MWHRILLDLDQVCDGLLTNEEFVKLCCKDSVQCFIDYQCDELSPKLSSLGL